MTTPDATDGSTVTTTAERHDLYLDGRWVSPHGQDVIDVVDPSTETVIGSVRLGDATDVDAAVRAARAAFPGYAATSVAERLDLLDRVTAEYARRREDLARAVSAEMGAPISLARTAHTGAGLSHLRAAKDALADFPLTERIGSTSVVYEPIGVCAFITPWNWPLNQIFAKVAPALAAGCTMILKPSEFAPLSARIVAEILDAAGVPGGVFNLVNGTGATVGTALAEHPDVDAISFTGSTRAGIEVARRAAPTVKRVMQELGGNSANIVLDDADLEEVVSRDVRGVYTNSGQSCNASARILIPRGSMDQASDAARRVAESLVVGPPADEETTTGPVATAAQFDKVQGLINAGIAEGARLVAGGPGRPDGRESGYFVRPTVFADVTNDMRIAAEEIFGPVVTLIEYEDEGDAIRIANDTTYGLSAMVSSSDPDRALRVARQIRSGMVHLNGAPLDRKAPFGGYQRSGNGREFGAHGLREFFETKSIYGCGE